VNKPSIAVIGGGASGIFFAVACGERLRAQASLSVYEKSAQWLSKVKVSGGGRCNVTHACFDPKQLCTYYPRGSKELLGAFQIFQPTDTIEWFAQKKVRLKTEPDGRMFPISNTSQTILDCLLMSAQDLGINLIIRKNVSQIIPLISDASHSNHPLFQIHFSDGETVTCNYIVLANGGPRANENASLPESLGHTLAPPVPSLFTFKIEDSRLHDLQGISIPSAKAYAPAFDLESKGPLLITHWGLSGPCILKLSAWGARAFASCNYEFDLWIDWLPEHTADVLQIRYQELKSTAGRKTIWSAYNHFQLPERLWVRLCEAAGINSELLWSYCTKPLLQSLVNQLKQACFQVKGKSLNKEEFVTCGGVSLKEIHFKTFESKKCPGLYCIGEALDIDGLTGGFNFQSCWTTAWIAANAIAKKINT
jgi:predicted Rossmann fold flavoprotein